MEAVANLNVSSVRDMITDSNLIKKNFVKIQVVTSNVNGVMEYQDVPAVNFESFIGSLGGILNLWIGLSFITVIEVIELAINLVHSSRKSQ